MGKRLPPCRDLGEERRYIDFGKIGGIYLDLSAANGKRFKAPLFYPLYIIFIGKRRFEGLWGVPFLFRIAVVHDMPPVAGGGAVFPLQKALVDGFMVACQQNCQGGVLIFFQKVFYARFG